MIFVKINQASNYTNTGNNFLVLMSWNGLSQINTPEGVQSSGAINAFAGQGFILVPPQFTLVYSSQLTAYGFSMSFDELQAFFGVV